MNRWLSPLLHHMTAQVYYDLNAVVSYVKGPVSNNPILLKLLTPSNHQSIKVLLVYNG